MSPGPLKIRRAKLHGKLKLNQKIYQVNPFCRLNGTGTLGSRAVTAAMQLTACCSLLKLCRCANFLVERKLGVGGVSFATEQGA
jgi:hypothetical protein